MDGYETSPGVRHEADVNGTLPSAETRHFLCAKFGFQFYFNTVVLSLLCIIGLAGNTISLLVLQKDRHNRVAVFLLQSLALGDSSLLATGFIVLSVAYGLLPITNPAVSACLKPYIIKYINALGNTAHLSVIWLTLMLAVNRYIAICRPFTAKRWLSMAFARIQVAIVVIVSVALNIPRILIYLEIPASCEATVMNNSTTETPFGLNDLGKSHLFKTIYWNGFYTPVMLILPQLLLIAFNVPLIRQTQRSKRRMKQNSLSYRGRQEDSITMVMIVIIIKAIIFHIPDTFTMVVKTLKENDDEIFCPYGLFFAINISNLLVNANSSTNFIVYYVLRRRFRRILCSKLLCNRSNSISGSAKSEAGTSRLNTVCRHDNGSVPHHSHHRRKTLEDEDSGERKLTLKERYKLTKKRDSSQTLLVKLNNAFT